VGWGNRNILTKEGIIAKRYLLTILTEKNILPSYEVFIIKAERKAKV